MEVGRGLVLRHNSLISLGLLDIVISWTNRLSPGIRVAIQPPGNTTEMIMAEKRNDKCWNTRDFEVRFREAMGREMTPEERDYFGLTEESTSANAETADSQNTAQTDATQNKPPSDRTEFAWQTLRHISALLG